MVAKRVKKAMPQLVEAMSNAALASEMPMTMATEPVMMGGKTLSRAFFPAQRMRRPAMMETRAVAMMPPWATRTPPHSAPTIAETAAM